MTILFRLVRKKFLILGRKFAFLSCSSMGFSVLGAVLDYGGGDRLMFVIVYALLAAASSRSAV